MIPTETVRFFQQLAEELPEVVGPHLEAEGKFGDATFECRVAVEQPNPERLPALVVLQGKIPVQFPYAKIEFVPQSDLLRGFAHQDGRTGALCLEPEIDRVREPLARLRAHVDGAREWIEDAAHGRLLRPGEPWELPDFRIRRPRQPPTLVSVESEDSFDTWESRIGFWGIVQLVDHACGHGVIPVAFGNGEGLQFAPQVNEAFLNRSSAGLGAWALVSSHVVERHRPARTYDELEVLFREVGLDLWAFMHRAVKCEAFHGYHFALVGAPIPRRVGGAPSEVHWQPIAVPEGCVGELRGRSSKRSRRGGARGGTFRERLERSYRSAEIPWGLATSYSSDRAESRGSLLEDVKGKRVCVLGCGAIGSQVAEHLARGGVRDLCLFDKEVLDLENLSRHSLGVPDVGKPKATALADRLSGLHPAAQVRGLVCDLPPRPAGRVDSVEWDCLNRAEVLIDCTASESVFLWASRFGRAFSKSLIHIFVNAHARMLTLCCSGRHASCEKVASLLFRDIGEGRAGFSVEEYESDEGELLPGAGCWHATFPALGSNISALVASAIPVVEGMIREASSSRGTSVVLRRREFGVCLEVGRHVGEPLVEVAWAARYR